MSTRAYTVNEIDNLRSAVENRLIWGHAGGHQWKPGEASVFGRMCPSETCVQERVRTYMLAGITSQDLIDADTASYSAAVSACEAAAARIAAAAARIAARAPKGGAA
jgi:hypothetical protein